MGKLIYTAIIVVFLSASALAAPAEPAEDEDTIEVVTDVMFTGIGGGLYVNALNFSVGPMLVLWPLDDLGLQAIYGMGIFTTYEARLLYRTNVSENHNFYIGAGYLHAEKDVTVEGLDTRITGDGLNLFAGMERAVTALDPFQRDRRRLLFYIEFSKPFINLEKEVSIAGDRKKAAVDYGPFSIGTGIAYYLW